MGVWLLNITPVPMRQNQGFLLFLITQSGVKTIEYFHCTCRITTTGYSPRRSRTPRTSQAAPIPSTSPMTRCHPSAPQTTQTLRQKRASTKPHRICRATIPLSEDGPCRVRWLLPFCSINTTRYVRISLEAKHRAVCH